MAGVRTRQVESREEEAESSKQRAASREEHAQSINQ